MLWNLILGLACFFLVKLHWIGGREVFSTVTKWSVDFSNIFYRFFQPPFKNISPSSFFASADDVVFERPLWMKEDCPLFEQTVIDNVEKFEIAASTKILIKLSRWEHVRCINLHKTIKLTNEMQSETSTYYDDSPLIN